MCGGATEGAVSAAPPAQLAKLFTLSQVEGPSCSPELTPKKAPSFGSLFHGDGTWFGFDILFSFIRKRKLPGDWPGSWFLLVG